jgi:hypothetical protein
VPSLVIQEPIGAWLWLIGDRPYNRSLGGCYFRGISCVRRPDRGCSSVGRALESHSRGQGFESPQLHSMRDFSSDPDRQANIAFALIVLGIIFVGGLTIWLFYGAQF